MHQVRASRRACLLPSKTGLAGSFLSRKSTKGVLNLYCKEGIDEIRLLDAQGSRMLQVQPGLKTVRLTFPGQKPGLYLAQIRSGERWVVKKVLVNSRL